MFEKKTCHKQGKIFEENNLMHYTKRVEEGAAIASAFYFFFAS